jgi:hypothetical protein
MKTLLRTAPAHRLMPHRTTAPLDKSPCPRPVRLGHIHKSASPFNQHQPGTPATGAGTFPPGRPGTRNQTWSSPNITCSDRIAQISRLANLISDL